MKFDTTFKFISAALLCMKLLESMPCAITYCSVKYSIPICTYKVSSLSSLKERVLKMKVQVLLLMFLLSGSCVSDKKLYLIDLYACVDEFEDYCHQIPEWTVRAAIGLANDSSDVLPGYALYALSRDFYPNKSLVSDGEVSGKGTARDT